MKPGLKKEFPSNDGTGRVRILLAENDPASPWTIRVRDAATDVTATAILK